MSSSRHHPPNRQEGLARLHLFAPHAGGHYARERNFDLGSEQRGNVSLLSPYLRHRMVLETEVLEVILAQHSLGSAEKFVQEVCWRTYWKGWLELRPSVWARYQSQLREDLERLAGDPILRAAYDRAVRGQSGIDALDCWARELVETGYLHNHARMWFASLWVYTLELPWALGADFFYRHLLDGDPASNTLSWRWVCGLHTRGKTYLARPDNIAEFTRGRFTPAASELAGNAPPLEEDPPPAASDPLPAEAPWSEGVHGRCALLLTEEDLHSESWPIHDEVVGLASVACTGNRSPDPVGERALTFAHGALADGLQRAVATYGEPGTAFDHPHTDEVVAWCRDLGVQQLVTAWAPVGPVAAFLQQLRSELATQGIDLLRLRRPWDDMAWHHARRGFFPFKRQIPTLLEHCLR